MKRLGMFAMGWVLASSGLVFSQGSHNDYEENAANVDVDHALLEGLEFRDVGFTRGGRSTAAVGVARAGRAPLGQQRQEVDDADGSVAVAAIQRTCRDREAAGQAGYQPVTPAGDDLPRPVAGDVRYRDDGVNRLAVVG